MSERDVRERTVMDVIALQWERIEDMRRRERRTTEHENQLGEELVRLAGMYDVMTRVFMQLTMIQKLKDLKMPAQTDKLLNNWLRNFDDLGKPN